jgi:hypothetical protein
MSNPEIVAEVRSVKETADKMANGDYPEEADHSRALAGMIRQLAEQIERHLGDREPTETTNDEEGSLGMGAVREGNGEAERSAEEDRTPEEAPADPADPRTE